MMYIPSGYKQLNHCKGPGAILYIYLFKQFKLFVLCFGLFWISVLDNKYGLGMLRP